MKKIYTLILGFVAVLQIHAQFHIIPHYREEKQKPFIPLIINESHIDSMNNFLEKQSITPLFATFVGIEPEDTAFTRARVFDSNKRMFITRAQKECVRNRITSCVFTYFKHHQDSLHEPYGLLYLVQKEYIP